MFIGPVGVPAGIGGRVPAGSLRGNPPDRDKKMQKPTLRGNERTRTRSAESVKKLVGPRRRGFLVAYTTSSHKLPTKQVVVIH